MRSCRLLVTRGVLWDLTSVSALRPSSRASLRPRVYPPTLTDAIVEQKVEQNKRELEALAVDVALLCATVAKAVRGMTDAECQEKLQPIDELVK